MKLQISLENKEVEMLNSLSETYDCSISEVLKKLLNKESERLNKSWALLMNDGR